MNSSPQARLQSANVSYRAYPDLTHTTRADLPAVAAWRTSKGFAAYKCLFCGGPHKNADPTLAIDGNRTRVVGCYEVFRQRTGDEVNLAVSTAEPPPWLATYVREEQYFGQLAAAASLIVQGNAFSFGRFERRDLGEEVESFWLPSREDIRLALHAVERVGALDQARSLRAEMGETVPRRMRRGAAVDFWTSQPGENMRARLSSAIKSAYRMEHFA